MKSPILEMRHITKQFPGVIANEDVNLSLYPGEVHALLGENGAGKSTLMNILTGIYFPNKGEILYEGEPVEISSPKKAVALGIGMVHQHFKLVQTMSVAENVALYSGGYGFFVNKKAIEQRTEALAAQFHLAVSPQAQVSRLSVGEQQRVEILKLLASGAQVLALDEPTAVLTPQESRQLFASLRQMALAGKAVLVITHKLSEVVNFADRVTVLRGGKFVAEKLLDDTNMDDLTKMMVGRHIAAPEVHRGAEKREEVLSLQNVSVKNGRAVTALKNVSLQLFAGEILGVAGVSGNGQRELCQAIAGLSRLSSGTLSIRGEIQKKWNAAIAVRRGIAYVPDDRIGVGLASHLNIPDNLLLKNYQDQENSHCGVIKRKAVYARAEKLAEDFDVRHAGLDRPVANMSGGNIQKLLFAREISMDPQLIVASYPSHGLDIGATNSVHQILLAEKEKGKAILLVSEDLDEIFSISDRIAVLYNGELAGVMPAAQADADTVGRMMLGSVTENAAGGGENG